MDDKSRHDFKNQLGIILAFSEILLAEAATSDSQRRDLKAIHQAATAALALLARLSPTPASGDPGQRGDAAMTDGRSAPRHTTVSAEQLARLPQGLVAELRTATVSGNKNLLDQLICKVRETGHTESAHLLQALADHYEYDSLTQLLEEACPR